MKDRQYSCHYNGQKKKDQVLRKGKQYYTTSGTRSATLVIYQVISNEYEKERIVLYDRRKISLIFCDTDIP